jgi:hypothetical protein
VRVLSPADNSVVSGVVEVPVWYNTPTFPIAVGSCGASIRFIIDGNTIYESSILSACDSVYVNQTFGYRLYTTEYSNGGHVLRAEMKMYHPDLGWFGWWYDEIRIMIVNPVTTTSQTLTYTSSVQTSTFTITTTATSTLRVTIQDTIIQMASNSTIADLILDTSNGIINFTVSGPSGTTGYFNATIAKSLLRGSPIVNIDGSQVEPTVSQDETYWYVYVAYQHSVHHVTIGGSMAISEFTGMSFFLFVVVLIVTLTMRRKRNSGHDADGA